MKMVSTVATEHYVLFVDGEGQTMLVNGEPAAVFACDQRTPIDPFAPLPDGLPRCATCTHLVETGAVS